MASVQNYTAISRPDPSKDPVDYTKRAKVVIHSSNHYRQQQPKRPTISVRARSEYAMSHMRARQELSSGGIRTQADVAEAIALSRKMFIYIPILCIGTFVLLGILGWLYVMIWHPERLVGWYGQRINSGRRDVVFA